MRQTENGRVTRRPTPEERRVVQDVKLELKALERIGVSIPVAAYRVAERVAVEYRNGGMRITEIADACVVEANSAWRQT